MEISAVLHYPHSSYCGFRFDLTKENVKEIKTKKYWIEYFKNKIEQSQEKFSMEMKDLYKDLNLLTIESSARDIERYTIILKSLHSGIKEVFIKELVGVNLENDDEVEEVLKLDKISIYINQYDFRASLGYAFFRRYEFVYKNMINDRIKEITNGNSEKLRKLTKEDIDYIEDLLDITKSQLTIKTFLTEEQRNKNYSEYLTKFNLMIRDNLSPLVYILGNLTFKMSITNGFFEYSKKGRLVEYSNGDFIYFEDKNNNYDFMALSINNVLYTYYVENWGEFNEFIENIELVAKNVDKFPQYQIMNEEIKKDFSIFIKKFIK